MTVCQSGANHQSTAVLELFKQGFVDLDQPRTFGDIQIVWLGRDRNELEELSAVDAYDG